MKEDTPRLDPIRNLLRVKIELLARFIKRGEETSLRTEREMIFEAGKLFKKNGEDSVVESFEHFITKKNMDNDVLLIVDIIIYGSQLISSGCSFKNEQLGKILYEFSMYLVEENSYAK